MNIDAGTLLKKLREDFFQESIRNFSNKINMHYTTYHNYEINKFGKNPINIFHDLSIGISNLISTDAVLKSDFKNFILNLFLKSFKSGSQDFNYLFTADISSDKTTIDYLKYVFFLAHTHCHLKEIIFESNFHEEQRDCINKIVNLSKPKNISIIGHIEDYTIHLKTAYDHPKINFNCMLDRNSNSINDVIDTKCINMNIRNFSLSESFNKSTNRLNNFVIVYFCFHHIQKKIDKFQFLKDLNYRMNNNSLLCIIEPFFENDDEDYISFKSRWKMVEEDINAKSFWNSLNNIDKQSIEKANLVANQAEQNMKSIGINYINSTNEFLVTPEFLEKNAKKAGFKLLFNRQISYLPDRLFLFEK